MVNNKYLIMKKGLDLNSTIIKDASIQASMQHWVEMECNQLSSGDIVGEIDILELDSIKLVRESQLATVQKTGITASNFCALSYCSLNPKFRFSEQIKNAADTLFFLPELTEYDIFVPAGVQTTYVALDQKKFLDGARILNPMLWDKPPSQLIALKNTQQLLLKRTLDMWFNIADTSNGMEIELNNSTLNKNLFEYLLQIVTKSNSDIDLPHDERLFSFQTYQVARSYIEDQLNINVTPSIVSICKFVGVAERTLQYAFRSHVNMTPIAYLRLPSLTTP